jgi:hypothetical protein
MLSNLLKKGALCLSLFTTMACGPVVNEAYMAKDDSGKLKATKFDTRFDEIHCYVLANGGDTDTVLYFDAEGPDGLRFKDEIYPWPNRDELGETVVTMQLILYDADDVKQETGFPVGDYRMVLEMEGEQVADLRFEVY